MSDDEVQVPSTEETPVVNPGETAPAEQPSVEQPQEPTEQPVTEPAPEAPQIPQDADPAV